MQPGLAALAAIVVTAAVACRDPAPPPAPPETSVTVAMPVHPATPTLPVAPAQVRDASARPAPAPTTVPAPVAPAVVAPAPAPSPAAHGDAGALTRGFLGENDDAILSRICNAPIERFERNRGGSTISFRIRFEGGQRGLFKPQQRSEVANFRAELAAYRMSRLLGLHRVPPACGRLVTRDVLQRTADATGDAAFSQRTLAELLGRGDNVPGAVLYWVPGQLEPVPGADTYATLLDAATPLTPENTALAADLSKLLVFDFLNDNVDRWSGGNVLRQRAAPGAPPGDMLFMDNGAAFSAVRDGLGARPTEQSRRLGLVGRFSRSLVERLRGLTEASLRAAMSEDPIGPCLSDLQIRAVLTRRDRIVARVDALLASRPESEVLPFP